MLIYVTKNVGIKKLKNRKVLIDYSQTIVDVYENLVDCNPPKKIKVIVVVNNMIADIEKTPRFTRFISRSYLTVPKTIRINATWFYYENYSKRILQQIASNHSRDIDFKDLIKLKTRKSK